MLLWNWIEQVGVRFLWNQGPMCKVSLFVSILLLHVLFPPCLATIYHSHVDWQANPIWLTGWGIELMVCEALETSWGDEAFLTFCGVLVLEVNLICNIAILDELSLLTRLGMLLWHLTREKLALGILSEKRTACLGVFLVCVVTMST